MNQLITSSPRAKDFLTIGSLALAIGFASASSAGGGGDDEGMGHFEITKTVTGTGTGENVWIDAQGVVHRDPSTSIFAIGGATISGVGTTAKGTAKGKTHFVVRWVGGGTPPPYAYIKLVAGGEYKVGDGRSGTVDPGLPLKSDITDDKVRTISGQKIAKLKIGPSGTAEFDVEGGATCAITTPTADGSLTNNTHCTWGATATTELKALGLFMETFKRVSDSPPVGPPLVQRVSAAGDDLEDQQAEIGLDPFDSQSNIFQAGICRPQAGSWLLLPFYNSDLTVTGGPGYVQNVGFARDATSFDFMPYLGDPATMRQSPVESKFSGNQSDPGSANVGPFKGKLTVKAWAIERLLYKQAINTRMSKKYVPIYTNYPSLTPVVSGIDVVWGETQTITQAYSVAVGTTTTTGVSGGFYGEANPIKEIFKLGVKVDGKREWADVKNTTTTVTVASAYANNDEMFNPYHQNVTYKRYVRAEHKDMWRNLAKYGPSGYEADYSNTILDFDEPALYPGTDRFLTPQ